MSQKKKQGFTHSLENTVLEKTQMGSSDKVIDLAHFILVTSKCYHPITTTSIFILF